MVNTEPRRSGRRAGAPETRAAILRAARESFATGSYETASIRRIAARAGVDPALVLHYFESKEQLFDEAVDFPFDPDAVAERVLGPGVEGLGRRFAAAFLDLWESDEYGLQLRGIFRAAVSSDTAAAKLRNLVEGRLVTAVARRFPVPFGERYVPLLASQLLGVAFLRYIVRVGPLASMPRDELVGHLAASIESVVARVRERGPAFTEEQT